ncbi:HotDog domain-containing protein [Boeremia exigua]|uniref:HotDog domain-containing protein n=1 Tax=Boeremia exigua TaxID=749465 RepID=UPI001E8E468B|nr:HotDog domain-containing protein [Boeremia exigua]KAH6625927.1 HotDog domain-containing protein [Boeremia exigua]
MSDQEFFSSIPIIQDLLARPENIRFTPTCRLKGEEAVNSKTKDQFFRHGLATTDLVPYAIAFYEDPFRRNSIPSPIGQKPHTQELRLLIRKSTLVLSLQSGTVGFNGTAHGGLIATIIDEAMGSLILINHKVYSNLPSSTREKLSNKILDMYGLALFTAEMNVRFCAPLPTPRVVLVETVVKDIRGRKVFISVVVQGLDGTVYAMCDGMWMSVRGQQKI